MKKQRRVFRWIFMLCMILLLSVIPVQAEENAIPEDYYQMEELFPEDTRELFPGRLFSHDQQEVESAAGTLTDPGYWAEVLIRLAGLSLKTPLSLFVTLCGILILSAVANAVREGVTGQTGNTFSFCVRVTVFAAISGCVVGTLETVRTYFSALTSFSASLIPLLGTLFAMGGNIQTAVSSSAVLEIFLSLVGQLAGGSVIPVFCACMTLLLIGSFGSLDTGSLSAFLRKTYTTVLAFLMLLLSAVLAGQSVLSARADSLGMRGVRFAVGNLVPLVGGTVAEMSRTVAASVDYLRGSVGITLIVLLAFLLLPTVFHLFFTRMAFQLASVTAGLLGCKSEAGLLGGIAELYGYLIGIACLTASVLVVALTILIRCGCAVGG